MSDWSLVLSYLVVLGSNLVILDLLNNFRVIVVIQIILMINCNSIILFFWEIKQNKERFITEISIIQFKNPKIAILCSCKDSRSVTVSPFRTIKIAPDFQALKTKIFEIKIANLKAF